MIGFLFFLPSLTMILVVWRFFFLICYNALTCIVPFFTSMSQLLIDNRQFRYSNLENKILVRSMLVCLSFHTTENIKSERTCTKNCNHRQLLMDLTVKKNNLIRLAILVFEGVRGVIYFSYAIWDNLPLSFGGFNT